MYTFSLCRHPGCNKFAISRINKEKNIIEDGDFCLDHQENKESVQQDILNYISANEKIVGLNANGIIVENQDISDKKFYGCMFLRTKFNNVHITNMRVRMCMFDFSMFTSCGFIKSNIQFSSLSGSRLEHVYFTGSDLVHNNFNGIMAYQSSFDGTNLYNSRFIKAVLINTSMNDCNLKKAIFYESMREGISCKYSNTNDALTERDKSKLRGDFNNSFFTDGGTQEEAE